MENGGILILLMHQTAVHLFAFFSLNLPQVELELFALQDVAICPAALTGSGGNAGCRGVGKLSQIRISITVETKLQNDLQFNFRDSSLLLSQNYRF